MMRFIKIANIIALAAGQIVGDAVLVGLGATGLSFCTLDAATEADNHSTCFSLSRLA